MTADREEWSEFPIGATTATRTKSGTSVIRRSIPHIKSALMDKYPSLKLTLKHNTDNSSMTFIEKQQMMGNYWMQKVNVLLDINLVLLSVGFVKICSSHDLFNCELQRLRQILVNNCYTNTDFDFELNKY